MNTKWKIDTGVIFYTDNFDIWKEFKELNIREMAVYFKGKTLVAKQFLVKDEKLEKKISKKFEFIGV